MNITASTQNLVVVFFMIFQPPEVLSMISSATVAGAAGSGLAALGSSAAGIADRWLWGFDDDAGNRDLLLHFR
jgi:hypothetical protein